MPLGSRRRKHSPSSHKIMLKTFFCPLDIGDFHDTKECFHSKRRRRRRRDRELREYLVVCPAFQSWDVAFSKLTWLRRAGYLNFGEKKTCFPLFSPFSPVADATVLSFCIVHRCASSKTKGNEKPDFLFFFETFGFPFCPPGVSLEH